MSVLRWGVADRFLASWKFYSSVVPRGKRLFSSTRSCSSDGNFKVSYVCGPSDVPLSGLTVGQLLQEAADRYGDRTGVVSVHQNIRKNFTEILRDADQLAAGFLELKLKCGDRVGIWGPNSYEWIAVQWAAARAGLVLVNINPAYKSAELSYAINKVEIKALVMAERFRSLDLMDVLRGAVPELETATGPNVSSSKCPSLGHVILLSDSQIRGTTRLTDVMDSATPRRIFSIHQLQRRIQFDEPVNIQFTSGTTGNPKGATLSHHNIVNNAILTGIRIGFHEQVHRIALQVPLYHCFGCVLGVLIGAAYGASCVLPSETFSALETMRSIHDERCTAVYGTPTMFVDLLNVAGADAFDVSNLSTALMAGAPCPEELARQITQRLNIKYLNMAYGMTEASPLTFTSAPNDSIGTRCTTVGYPGNHVEIKVVDPETGEIVPVNSPGEICSRGYNTMLGYWNDADKTAEAIKSDRWLHSGDIGTIDENGYGRIVGRIKDMIIRGGENIYPREIEDLLHTHPHVLEAHVVGVPDRRMGEEVCAWVRRKSGAHLTADELRQFCRRNMAHFKVPRYWLFKEEFPLTVTGKVQKFRMREMSVGELNLNISH